jgi:hypothetical protein
VNRLDRHVQDVLNASRLEAGEVSLRPSSFIQTKSDEELVAFILAGRNGTAMDALEGILTEGEMANVLFLLRACQE